MLAQVGRECARPAVPQPASRWQRAQRPAPGGPGRTVTPTSLLATCWQHLQGHREQAGGEDCPSLGGDIVPSRTPRMPLEGSGPLPSHKGKKQVGGLGPGGALAAPWVGAAPPAENTFIHTR